MSIVIQIKAAPGRAAFTAPNSRERISETDPISVVRSPWITRCIQTGDIVEVAKKAALSTSAAPKTK